jgi:hypothetical protein
MSTQKGNIKKTGQKHQNTFAFKHNKNSMLTRKIQEVPLDFLCAKCLEIMEWKIKYRKYKPLSTPAKCTLCETKTVYKAHRALCDKCCIDLKLCSKCVEPCTEYARPTKSSKILRNRPKDHTFEEIVESLKERQRRTVQRKIENGEDIIFDGTKGIINAKTLEVVIDLKDINNGVLFENENDNDDEEPEEEGEVEEEGEGDSNCEVKEKISTDNDNKQEIIMEESKEKEQEISK